MAPVLWLVVCAALVAETAAWIVPAADLHIEARCPAAPRKGTNVMLIAEAWMRVRGGTPYSWSLCDDAGRCNRGEDWTYGYSMGAYRKLLHVTAFYRRAGRHELRARLRVTEQTGPRVVVGACTFWVQ